MSKIDASFRPVNGDAARAIGGGIHWTPAYAGNPHARRWDIPPQYLLRPVPLTKTMIDLIGRRLGRFTVIGYLGKLNPKKKALWLCRCQCGQYETRSSNAIKEAANPDDQCEACKYLGVVKAGRARSPLHPTRNDGGRE